MKRIHVRSNRIYNLRKKRLKRKKRNISMNKFKWQVFSILEKSKRMIGQIESEENFFHISNAYNLDSINFQRLTAYVCGIIRLEPIVPMMMSKTDKVTRKSAKSANVQLEILKSSRASASTSFLSLYLRMK